MEMNILGSNVYGASVHRLDINFNVKTNDLDSFIGRTAHINLIIRENLFKMLGVTLFSLLECHLEHFVPIRMIDRICNILLP